MSVLSAYTKTIFGKPVEVLPEEGTICKDIPFETADRTGDKYRFPIRFADEQSFTYSDAHGDTTLNDALAGDVQYAELEGAEIVGRAKIPYGEMSKLSESNSETKQAYKQAVGDRIASLMASAERRRELAIMYGSGADGLANLGVVNTVVSAVSTTLVVTLTRATWAAGLWPLLKGAAFDFHAGSTIQNADAALILSGVSQSNCRLTFTGDADDVAAVDAANVITFRGSRAESCVGIQAILENTGALFGPSAATYSQWKALSYAVGGALTFDKVAEGVTAAAENGADNGGTLYLPYRAWNDLMTDEAALRRHVGDVSADKLKTGHKRGSISFDTAAGRLKLTVHKFQKQGQAWFIADGVGKRVGSRDVSFKLPGNDNEWFFQESGSSTSSEIRCYGDQGIVLTRPNLCVNFTSISSTADAIPA